MLCWTMRGGWPPNDEAVRLIKKAGLRTRLLAAVLLAGIPALLLGANEARRNFDLAVAERAAVAELALQVAVSRVEDAVQSAAFVVDAMAEQPAIVAAAPTCGEYLKLAIARADRFFASSRVDPEGRVLCASRPFEPGLAIRRDPWFDQLRDGAPWATSSLLVGPLTGEPVLLIGAPVRGPNDDFKGAVLVSIQRTWLEQTLAAAGDPRRGVFVFDVDRQLVASATGALPREPALRAAKAALNDRRPERFGAVKHTAFGGALTVVVVEQRALGSIGLQAAMVALAPLLAVLLGVAAMWAALEGWVMRYFQRLENKARAFSVGIPSPQNMTGAPPELTHLAETLDQAFQRGRQREMELAEAAENNQRLSRELHHRVKNNLQVLTSLVSRQQKRAREPLVRAAVSEARARMTAVALVHRFIDPPEHLGYIDFDAYLAELARQLHVTLSGDARRIRLKIDVQGGELGVDGATVVGLIVAETFVAGYGATGGLSGGEAQIVWREERRTLSVSAGPAARPSGEIELDRAMIQELARQAGASVEFGLGAAVTLRWEAPAAVPD